MAVKSFVRDLLGGEKVVFNKLELLYQDVEYDVYIFHDIVYTPKFGKSFRPDFIILDPKRGLSVIEVKSYKKSLFKIDEVSIYFSGGSKSVSPFVQASDYRLKLLNYLHARDVEVDISLIQANLIFTNIKKKIQGVDETFLNTFYKNDLKALTLEQIFPYRKVEIKPDICGNLVKSLNSTFYFDPPVSADKSSYHMCVAELDEKQAEAVQVQIGGHHLVKGVPGSGKSIAAISRAIHVLKSRPKWRVLVLSVNRKLADQNKKTLNTRVKGLHSLGIIDGSLRCTTLMDFLQSLYDQRIEQKSYKAKLDFLTEECLRRPIEREWDYIIIDEYQDFNEDQFEVIKRAAILHTTKINGLEKRTENLFLVGDQLQQLNNSIGVHAWKKIGINIVGRTIKLKTVYRSSSNIIDLALNFIMDSSKGLKKEVLSFYEGLDDLTNNNNIKSDIEFISGDGGKAISRVKSWLQGLVGEGLLYEDILLIHPDCGKTKKYIGGAFVNEVKSGLSIGMPSTIKGIEAKAVVLWSIDQFKRSFDSDSSKAKKIYMSLTRGTMAVLIHSIDEENQDFNSLLRYTEDCLIDVA